MPRAQHLAHAACYDRVMLPAYGAGPYLPTIFLERPVYVREMADGLYSPLAYLLYKVGPTWAGAERSNYNHASILCCTVHC